MRPMCRSEIQHRWQYRILPAVRISLDEVYGALAWVICCMSAEAMCDARAQQR